MRFSLFDLLFLIYYFVASSISLFELITHLIENQYTHIYSISQNYLSKHGPHDMSMCYADCSGRHLLLAVVPVSVCAQPADAAAERGLLPGRRHCRHILSSIVSDVITH